MKFIAMILIGVLMGLIIKLAFDGAWPSSFGFGFMFSVCWMMFRDLIELWADLK